MSALPLLGIDVGGTKLLLLAQWSDHRDVDRVPTGSAFTGRHLDTEIDRFVSALGTAPVGAGVAVPGLVAGDGSVQTCDVLPLLVGWRAEVLGRLCPVRLLNDVEAASLAELLDLPGNLEAAVESAARHSMPELWKVCEVRRVRQGELTAALGALRAIGAELV